jgi:hypothetical protein
LIYKRLGHKAAPTWKIISGSSYLASIDAIYNFKLCVDYLFSNGLSAALQRKPSAIQNPSEKWQFFVF